MTTWPCFVEAMYILGKLGGWRTQSLLWEFVQRRGLSIRLGGNVDMERMSGLMEKYRDTPMDLADASLVVAAESLGVSRIFTLDSDFQIYRIHGRDAFTVVP